jgi:hypothetical protein
MKTRIPEKVTILTHNLHYIVIKFLEEYNKNIHDEGIDILKTEMTQPLLCQHAWKSWEKVLIESLLESGEITETDLVERDLEF